MATTLPLTDIPVPITPRPEGGYRVANTRVSLESVIWVYTHDGPSAERIHECFPSVDLPVAHAVVAYYHAHKELVDAYMVEEAAAEERSRMEDRVLHPQPTLEEFMSRRASA